MQRHLYISAIYTFKRCNLGRKLPFFLVSITVEGLFLLQAVKFQAINLKGPLLNWS